ncbi:putative ATP-dependent RNA helicase, mitochondrial [Glarea lozoyensis 74030]|uniref:ATP-dependent RNA helicase n=1 Tax=Glarea lozoyensis (strain ATCC 74030 / MF5533) TaxID=1104152 RepID=H0ESG2_GLAL7|nr:putative ATP-dependent RNA helicase, mitochondrial [Glarea lozoyensis 74030]
MDGNKRNPARRHPYRGKKAFGTNATPRQNVASSAQSPGIPRVATPPLTAPVPVDTPRFADLAKGNLLHPELVKTITEDLKFDHMMPVQAATLHDLLANRIDCLAQAKTGTGKTIAFLLPAIQTMINKRRSAGSGVSLLVISPTRELALQIAKEAKSLLQRFPQYKVGVAIGGTNKNTEEKVILGGCDILIATPGRYKFISTIPEGEAQTHDRVPQHLITVPTFSDVTAGLVGSIKSEVKIEGAKNGILVATDVVARGMDFPGVTNVFQVGIPSDKESYIHRLGRTGRAGAEGRGTFIVAKCEEFFPRHILKEITFETTEADLSAKTEVVQITEKMDNQSRTYQAWLGYYKGHMKPMGFDSEELVNQANMYARGGLGSPDTPTINKTTVGKMGLKGTKGLNVVADPPRVSKGGRRGGGGGGGEGRSLGSGGQGSLSNQSSRGRGGAGRGGGRGGGGAGRGGAQREAQW